MCCVLHATVLLEDDNTMLVCAILGSTSTEEYEDVHTLNTLLEEKNLSDDLDVHIHVNAASGSFVVPFIQSDLSRDFRLPLLCSIHVSSYKSSLIQIRLDS